MTGNSGFGSLSGGVRPRAPRAKRSGCEGDGPDLPELVCRVLAEFATPHEQRGIRAWMRPPSTCMTPDVLSAYKSTRLSFARVLARRMISERWRIERRAFQADADGDGHGRYEIEAAGHRLTYVVRSFRWDGKEKVGRRADGGVRDLFGAIFLGAPSDERIAAEMATLEQRDDSVMRTDAAVAGWNPANRSARFFDHTVECLAAGRQPDARCIGQGGGYLLRNGGYLGSGRFGTISHAGYPEGHPFLHPYFPDLFGLYLIRQVSIDLVNAIAARRCAHAVELSPSLSRYIGVGNSSGQGMCVAMQRWPHWISTWVLVRETAIAYAKSMPVMADRARFERMLSLLGRCSEYLESVHVQSEEYVVPPPSIARNLREIAHWFAQMARPARRDGVVWGRLLAALPRRYDRETIEQLHALLIEIHPEFSDAVAAYLPVGSARSRDVIPAMSVAQLRGLVARRYAWALRIDLTEPGARRHFWYHSADNGEQRRGDRNIDPHEEYESFIDHIGAVQHLWCVLGTYDDEVAVAEVIADVPDLAYPISRVQYLAGLPYAEIRGSLVSGDFIPAKLIRFMLATLGIECSNPLSVQYVRGVFFQGMPLPEEVAAGTGADWIYPAPSTT